MENRTTPLRGDGNGNYRIHIVGNSGSGKTTLCKKIGNILAIPHINLDELFWKPNWVESTPSELQLQIQEWTTKSGESWAIDGNYYSAGGKLVSENATDIIWLDPPFIITFIRLFKRTLLRTLGFEPPCSKGCEDYFFPTFFSISPKNNIMVYMMQNHSRVKCRMEALMKEYGKVGDMNVNGGDGKMRRFQGWNIGRNLSEWLNQLRGLRK